MGLFMKKAFFLLVFVFLATYGWSDTLELKNGTIVEGEIVERGDDFIRMNINGVRITYYNDEIENVQEASSTQKDMEEPRLTPMQILESGKTPTVNQLLTSLPTASDISNQPDWQSAQGTKRELILKFIVLFGTRDTMRANFEKMSASLPPEKAAAFRRAYNVDAVINLLIPIYDKYFTEEDLREYILFYASPAGKRLNASLASVMKESVTATMQYFELNMPPELKEQAPATASTQTGVPIQLPSPRQ